MSTLKRKAAAQAGAEAKKSKQGNIMSFFGAPKPSSSSSTGGSASKGAASAPEPAGPKFDKEKWVASLTPEQRELLQLEIDTLHESWLALLKDELVTKEFLELKRFLGRETAAGRKWFPPAEDVYSWSRHTPFNTVKVVILGQDPYHNVNQAHGLAFSVRPPTRAPPSLKNMYICLKNDYPSFNPPPNKGGLLTPWADRGVLMLNTCLTVRAHEANSHSNRGWERFTQKCIDLVAARRTRGVVFMAWGTPAGKRVLRVDGKRHLVLKTVHPSPLSASNGYFTCRHFRLANDWLAERYGPAGRVDWALNEGESVFDDEEKQEAAAEDKKEKEEEKVKEKEGVEEKEEKGKGFDEEEDGDVEDGDAADMLEAVVKAEAGVKAAALSSSFSSAAAALSLSSSSAAAAENSNAAEKEPVVAEERKTRSQKGAAEAPDGEENAAPEVEA